MVERSNVMVLKEYFGYKDGQSLKEFAGEVQFLSEEEKNQLANGIRDGSLTY